MKKILLLLTILLLAGYSCSNSEQNSIKINRETSDVIFSDYENLDKIIYDPKTEIEIIDLDNELAGYYAPKNLIHIIETQDVDMDSKLETIVSYSCQGCNAPSRNIDIIKNNKLIFTAHGANLLLRPLKEEAGFIISQRGLTMDRGDGSTETKFIMKDSIGFYPITETDIVEIN